MKPLTTLVIGFGRFPGAPVNPSAGLVRALGHIRRPAFGDARIVARVLPTTYTAITTELPELIRRNDPDVILMFGLAGRAKTLRVERTAVNTRSLLHPDAAGRTSPASAFVPGAPHVLKSAAPLIALAAAARSSGVNANISHNAGRYICNAALFTCLDLRSKTGRPRVVAFVHIPWPRKRLKYGKRGNRRHPTPAMLERAGAAILAAMLAAARRA